MSRRATPPAISRRNDRSDANPAHDPASEGDWVARLVHHATAVLRVVEGAARSIVRDAVREELHAHLALLSPANTNAIERVYLSTRQAARMVGVDPATIRVWIEQGDLPEHRAGQRLIRVRVDELRAFMERGPRRGDSVDLGEVAERIVKKGRRSGR